MLLLCITFIFGFEWARRRAVVQTSVSLKVSLVSKIRSVVWFLTVYCDWYNMPSVNNRNSRSLEVNLFWKIYPYLIANYLFIYINAKNCYEFTKSKILDLMINNGGKFHRVVGLKLKSFFLKCIVLNSTVFPPFFLKMLSQVKAWLSELVLCLCNSLCSSSLKL